MTPGSFCSCSLNTQRNAVSLHKSLCLGVVSSCSGNTCKYAEYLHAWGQREDSRTKYQHFDVFSTDHKTFKFRNHHDAHSATFTFTDQVVRVLSANCAAAISARVRLAVACANFASLSYCKSTVPVRRSFASELLCGKLPFMSEQANEENFLRQPSGKF